MALEQNTITVGAHDNSNDCVNKNFVTVISYAPDNDSRIIDNITHNSLESSLNSLTIHDHGMPETSRIEPVGSFASSSSAFTSFRRRIDSADSFASASSAFSLVPRTSDPSQPSRNIASIFRKNDHPRGIIVHPQRKGRPVVEFRFDYNDDDIPDCLLVPIL